MEEDDLRGESSDEKVEVGTCSPLYPGGLAPKRMRDETRGQGDRGKQHQKGGSRRQGGARGERIGDSKWCTTGFSVDPGGATLVAGKYIVKAVQSQVTLQGPAAVARRFGWC